MHVSGFVLGDRILGQACDSHPPWSAACGQLGPYRIIAASAIGKIHLRDGRPRDDAYTLRSAGPWLAVAVSDGLGSRQLSRYGASFAVEALCEYMLREATGVTQSPGRNTSPGRAELPTIEERTQVSALRKCDNPMDVPPTLWRRLTSLVRVMHSDRTEVKIPSFEVPDISGPSDAQANLFATLAWYGQTEHMLTVAHSGSPKAEVVDSSTLPLPCQEAVVRAFRHTREGLDQFAQSRDVPLRELHCTLLGLLLNTQTGDAAIGQIGDGLVAALHADLSSRTLVDPPAPADVGETYVLTQDNWQQFLATSLLPSHELNGPHTFYLMTDGVSEDCTHPPPDNVFQRWASDIDRELRKDEPLPQTASRLLRWLATYEVPGSWDDRTLIVILLDS